MFEITPQAQTALRNRLSHEELSRGRAFRFLDARDGVIRVDVGPRRDDDIEFKAGDAPVLYVPPDLAVTLETRRLDVAEEEEDGELLIRPAAAQDSVRRPPDVAPASGEPGLVIQPFPGDDQVQPFFFTGDKSIPRTDDAPEPSS